MINQSAEEEEAQLIRDRTISFETNVENLTEKRTTTRESAFEAVNKELRMNFGFDMLEKRKVTLFEAIKKGLKKGSVREQQLSAEALSIVFITLGADSEEIYKEVLPMLEEIISNPSTSKEVIEYMILCYGTATFIGNPDEPSILKNLDFLRNTLNTNTSNESTRAALKSYNLLLTTISKRHIYDSIVPNDIQLFVDYLQSEDQEVRMAAGESLALLFESGRIIEEDKFDIYTFGNDHGIQIDDLLDTLFGLTNEKSTKAKKDKSKKISFTSIKNYIENGEAPFESLVFKHQRYEFSDFTQIIQFNSIRDILGEGLQAHFESNELLHQIFDVIVDKNAKKLQLTAVEKRLYMSPSSPLKKQSTKNLNKQRNEKHTAKAFQLED